MEIISSRSKKTIGLSLALVLGLFPLLCLTSCKPITKEWVVNSLFPNLWVFLAHLIGVVILIVVMTWLLWKPTRNMLDKRHDYIAKQIADATKAKETAEVELQEANQLKVDALSQAMSITTQARAEAFDIVETAKSEAKRASAKIIKNAEADIQREKDNATANAQDNIINIAFDVAGNILEKEINKQSKDKYIDEILETIEEDIKKVK